MTQSPQNTKQHVIGWSDRFPHNTRLFTGCLFLLFMLFKIFLIDMEKEESLKDVKVLAFTSPNVQHDKRVTTNFENWKLNNLKQLNCTDYNLLYLPQEFWN